MRELEAILGYNSLKAIPYLALRFLRIYSLYLYRLNPDLTNFYDICRHLPSFC